MNNQPSVALIAKNFPPSKNQKPTDGSPYYSDNFHRFLKKNPSFNRVFISTWDFFNGCKTDAQDTLMVGKIIDGEFIGATLLKIRCTHRGQFQMNSYDNNFDVDNWIDVTDDFAIKYKALGRCAFSNCDHQWSESEIDLDSAPYGFEQVCLCCNAKQKKVKVETYEMENESQMPTFAENARR